MNSMVSWSMISIILSLLHARAARYLNFPRHQPQIHAHAYRRRAPRRPAERFALGFLRQPLEKHWRYGMTRCHDIDE